MCIQSKLGSSILAALMTVSLVACDDPLATLPPPPAPRELSLIGVLDPDSRLQYVHVEAILQDRAVGRITGRLYEEGILVATATAEDYGSQIGRCAGAFGGMLSLENGTCLEFSYWPRHGKSYRIEVEAEGYSLASGTTTIPSYFRILSAAVRGSPPGTGGFELLWNRSTGAHRYAVTVRSEDPGCLSGTGGDSCISGWVTETADTSLTGTVPEARLPSGQPPYVVEVVGFDEALYRYLTTGATGNIFVVPPEQNVTGGHGVIGSWVRRHVRESEPQPVVVRGGWDPLNLSPDAVGFGPRISTNAAGHLLVASSSGLLRSRDTGETWEQVYDAMALFLGSSHWGDFFTASSSLIHLPSNNDWVVRNEFSDMIQLVFPSWRSGVLFVRTDAEGTPPILLRSQDEGETFESIALPGLEDGRGAIVTAMAEDRGSQMVYAALHTPTRPPGSPPAPFARSNDGGVTWEATAMPLPWNITQNALSVGADGRIYAGISYTAPGLWISSDRGDIWARTFDRAVVDVLTDPSDPLRVWIVEGAGDEPAFEGNPGGVYVSVDGGLTFEPVGLQHAHVQEIALSADGRTLFAATTDLGLLELNVP